jgi:hypothetical protein
MVAAHSTWKPAMTNAAEVFPPELGQAAFGAPWQEYAMPEFVRAGLAYLGAAVTAESSTGANPTGNTGASFENEVFALRSHCWCDGGAKGHEEGCPPNFEHKSSGFDASWYKYLGRGSSVSAPITPQAFVGIVTDCEISLVAGGVRAGREAINSALMGVLPAGGFADCAIEGDDASLQLWLPWPRGVSPAPGPAAEGAVAPYVAAAEAALGPALATIGWTLLPGDGAFHLTAPLPPIGDGSSEDVLAAACYRELSDAELRAAGFEDPSEAMWLDRLELIAHSGINVFRSAQRA